MMGKLKKPLFSFLDEVKGENLKRVYSHHLTSYFKLFDVPLEQASGSDFSIERLESFKQHAIDRSLSANYINSNLTTLRTFIRYLASHQLLTFTQAEALTAIGNLPNKKSTSIPLCEAVDIEATIRNCADNSLAGLRDAAVLGLLLIQNLSRAQICRAEYADYDGVNGLLKVKMKSGLEMTEELQPIVQESVLDYVLEFRGEQPGPLFFPLNKNGEPKPGGRQLSPASVNLILGKRLADSAN